MTSVTVRRTTSLAPQECFAAITTWENHRVPLTSITRTPEGFTARTALGPVGFDDPMEIVVWEPPRSFELVKRGRVVLGRATVTIEPSATGSDIVWTEDLRIAGVPRALDPVVALATRAMVELILRRLLADG